jgi:hypothetical protein
MGDCDRTRKGCLGVYREPDVNAKLKRRVRQLRRENRGILSN